MKNQILSAFKWNSISRFGNNIIEFIISIVLARLLIPEEFGIIGMIVVFNAVANVFIDSGFGTALIQKKDADNKDFSTVFVTNLFLSFLIYILLFLFAPSIASFYNEAELELLVRIVSINLLVQSFGIIQSINFVKSLNFKTLAKINLISSILSGCVGIICAYQGMSYWSLVIRQITNTIINTVLLIILGDWKISFFFSQRSFKQLFSFGYKLLLTSLIDTIFNNLFPLLIGKIYNAKELGLYSRAKAFQTIPLTSISSIFSGVSFPLLAKMQDDEEKLKMSYRRLMTFAAFLNFPVMMGMAAVSESLVLVLLNNKWIEVIPYIQLLAIAGLLYPLQLLNLNVLNVKGRSDLVLKLEILKKGLIIIVIFIGINFGVKGLIIGQIITSIVGFFINTFYARKLINYSTMEQIKDVFPYLLVSIFMFFVITYLNSQLDFISIWGLIIQVITGGCMYLFISYIFKFDPFLQLHTLVKNQFALLKKDK